MMPETRLFNRVFYFQKYYDIFEDRYIYRFWILGFYFQVGNKTKERFG